MDVEQVRDCCLSLPGTTESFPFGKFPAAKDILVFKVEGKIYLFCDLAAESLRIEIKCGSEHADELRVAYLSVDKGFANKWISVALSGDMRAKEIEYWIHHSYRLVIAGLPRKIRDTYGKPE